MRIYTLRVTLANLTPLEVDLLTYKFYGGRLTHLGCGNYIFNIKRQGDSWKVVEYIITKQFKDLGIKYIDMARTMNCKGVSV